MGNRGYYNANDMVLCNGNIFESQGSGSRGIRIINDTANDRIDIEYLSIWWCYNPQLELM